MVGIRPNIYQVVPKQDFTVHVFFDDGKIKQYDVKPLIEKGGIFENLQDISFFIQRCTIMNNTLAWDLSGERDPSNCIDICPDTIYEDGITIKESEIA